MLLGDVMEGGGDEEAGATRGDAEVVGRGVDEDAEADASDDDAKLSSLGCAICVLVLKREGNGEQKRQ